jgi:hypothetical protein
MQIAEDLGLGRLAGSLALPIVCQTDNEALRTGGATVFSGRLSAVCFLTLILRFSLSERQELEVAQIVV